MTPTCPKCGSVRVEGFGDKRGICRERDCGHHAPWKHFKRHEPVSIRSPNTAWRDPSALSMDGQDR